MFDNVYVGSKTMRDNTEANLTVKSIKIEPNNKTGIYNAFFTLEDPETKELYTVDFIRVFSKKLDDSDEGVFMKIWNPLFNQVGALARIGAPTFEGVLNNVKKLIADYVIGKTIFIKKYDVISENKLTGAQIVYHNNYTFDIRESEKNNK